MAQSLEDVLQRLQPNRDRTAAAHPSAEPYDPSRPYGVEASLQTVEFVDISQIKTFPQALRHVNPILQSPVTVQSIKNLITEQNVHEREWFDGRKKLVQLQVKRNQQREELGKTLATFTNGESTNKGSGVGSEDKSEELDAQERKEYDMKILKVLQQMDEHQELELTKMGIPFFGVNSARVPEQEWKKLQKKMIDFLEEYVK